MLKQLFKFVFHILSKEKTYWKTITLSKIPVAKIAYDYIKQFLSVIRF